MGENKEIKINLWTFYVLAAGIVMLIIGILMAGFAIMKGNNNQQLATNNSETVKNETVKNETVKNETVKNETIKGETIKKEEERKILSNDGVWNGEEYKYEYPTLSKYPNMDNLLRAFNLYYAYGADMTLANIDRNNITNSQIFKIVEHIAKEEIQDDDEIYNKFVANDSNVEEVDDSVAFYTAKSIEEAVQTVFGNKVSYEHRKWENNIEDYTGVWYANYLDGYYAVLHFYLGGPWYSYMMGQYINKVEQVGNNIEITVSMADYKFNDEARPNDETVVYDVYNIRQQNVAQLNYIERTGVDDFNEKIIIDFLKENQDKVNQFKYVFTKDAKDGNYYFDSFTLVK